MLFHLADSAFSDCVDDQAPIFGPITKLRDLGFHLISVESRKEPEI